METQSYEEIARSNVQMNLRNEAQHLFIQNAEDRAEDASIVFFNTF
jgi:hypothetical protein